MRLEAMTGRPGNQHHHMQASPSIRPRLANWHSRVSNADRQLTSKVQKPHTGQVSASSIWERPPPTKRQFCGPIRGASSSHLFSRSAGEKNMGAVTFASQLASPVVNARFVESRDCSRMLSGPRLKSARWRNGTRRAWPAPVAEVTNLELRLAKDDRAMNQTVGTSSTSKILRRP